MVTEDRRPYQEDRWEMVRLGEKVVLEFSLPDNRCITVNYNQHTAQRWVRGSEGHNCNVNMGSQG